MAIPVDTHVFQIAKANYVPHLSEAKTVTERVYNEISTHFQNLFGSYSGWAHSVRDFAQLNSTLVPTVVLIINEMPLYILISFRSRSYSVPTCVI